ncbi:hypothetical protein CHS0354_006089 [Potamilus streckersoni]|uniref:Ras-related protein Rab-24 n=1 Tax=Potamilus streckersoni TaxID=2493646 RepID=A0AAE0W190_9BIVA|nr:hypothetical protein CHS0354_006089 [Potamilus streckersoni]
MAMSSLVVDCKVVLLGSVSVGKSSLIERYIHDKYSTTSDMDTTGSERYDSMTRMYYRNANAAIICYDITKQMSFDKAYHWAQELLINEENCRIYLCGTKKDLVDNNESSREVDVRLARKLAEDLKGDIFETSSKTGENVDLLFKKIAQDYTTDIQLIGPLHRNNSIKLFQDHSPKLHRCCHLT